MIRKLRRKFVLVFIGVATTLLAALLAGLYLSNAAHYRHAGMEALRSALIESGAVRGGVPVAVAETGPGGQIFVLHSQPFFMTEQDVTSAVLAVIGTGQETGELPARNLRFLSHEFAPGRVRYAFADIYGEKMSLRAQAFSSAVIGGAVFCVFLIFSVLLSRWIVAPVEEAWKRQRQFVADASHELKTPLTVALSNVDMVLPAPEISPDGKNHRRLEIAKIELLHMKDLVEKLLALARSDAAKEDPRAAPFSSVDLSHLLTCAAASFEPVFFESGRQLCAEIAPGCRIIGDAGTLSELFGILLDNARKYSAPGSTASIRLERDRSDGFCLTVENDGSTIPPEELPHIFERFYRGTSSRGEVSGSGLGLSIAEEIVKRHGGKIWAASTRGHTAFYVRLLQAG